MALKSRRWLVIGGGILGGLVLLCLIAFLIFSITGSAGGSRQLTGATSPQLNALDAERAAKGLLPSGGEPGAPPAPVESGFGGGFAGEQPAAADSLAFLPTQAAANVAHQQDQRDRLIIRNGTVVIYAENTYSAEKSIEAMVGQMAGDGAFVVSTSESPSGYGEAPYINMVIRIPAKNFDSSMDAIARLAAKGTTPTLTKTGEDVTDQYVDVKARLGSLEAARDRLRQIMSEAQNTSDLLQAEQQLTQREAEIESLKGRMQYLEQSAALSSINITLQPYSVSQPVDSGWHPEVTFRRAVDQLLENLRDFGDFLIIFVISVVPWLLVFGLVIYGVYRFIRGQVMRMRAKQPTASGSDEES